MADVVGRHIKYEPSDEQFMRRLAGALVVHWSKVPKPLQELLVRQAGLMADRENHAQLESNIARFIRDRQEGDA